MSEIEFKNHTIRHILDGQKVNRYAGPDGSSPLVPNRFALELAPSLWKQGTGILTKIWKSVQIKQILKKGN